MFNYSSTSQTLQILTKVSLSLLESFELKYKRMLFRCFLGLMLVLLIQGTSLVSHKSFKYLFTYITLLFQLSLQGIVLKILTSSLLAVTSFPKKTIDSEIVSAFLFGETSFVPTWNIRWSGLFSLIQGFM